MQLRKDAGDVLNRLEELQRVIDEHLQRAQGHAGRQGEHGVSARIEHVSRSQRAQRYHQGEKQGAHGGRANGHAFHLCGKNAEFLNVFFFAHQGLGGFGAHDALVEGAGDFAVNLARFAVRGQNALLKAQADQRQRRQHQDDHGGQPPVQQKHLHRAGDEKNDAPNQIQQRPTDGIRQALGIGGHAAEQETHRHAVIVGKGQLLELVKAHFADKVAYAHLHLARQIEKRENAGYLRKQNAHVQRYKTRHALGGVLRDEVVDGVTRHHGKGHVRQGADAHGQSDQGQLPMVGLGNHQQPFP